MTREPAVTKEMIHNQARGESASQATVIEQSRAIAEVQGALVVAQQRPRDQAEAIRRVREACKQLPLAEAAFFEFSRGGGNVSGETIHLAREMALCWGNITHGIAELGRTARESEMMAYAWDLETNTRSEMKFIVPHLRDTRQGLKPIVDMRDIYENNANMGARRVRECIFSVLPVHVREIAKATCLATLQKGESEKPLNVRIAELLEIGEELGISRARIEARFGPVAGMTTVTAASLHVAIRSVKRNETSSDEAFPRVGVEEATQAARALVDKTKRGGADTVTAESPNAEEGRSDGDRGEAHNGADERRPARQSSGQPETVLAELEAGDHHRAIARRLIGEAQAKELLADLITWERETGAEYDALPDGLKVEVDAAIAAKREKLRSGAK